MALKLQKRGRLESEVWILQDNIENLRFSMLMRQTG